MGCPECGSDRFFIKDPEDEYEFYGCQLVGWGLVFEPEVEIPEVGSETVLYCENCAWHGKLKGLLRDGKHGHP